ncbi:homoserine kinase [Floccifex sp.]|uniref:homoserine kinase n=1 Tax=Floccifex sp. TaxID=2815810 RepID=UPI003EFFF3C1
MIKVHVPGTSANLCIGYDCLGLAVDLYNHFTFEKSETLQITGCDPQFQNEENLVVVAFKYVCQKINKPFPSFHLHIDSQIPVSSGLGSSASCLVAGILAANAWYQAKLDTQTLVTLATELEGHPDNVAPAILGQASISFEYEGKIISTILSCENWHGLVMMPPYQVNTKKARKVLPKTIEHKQAALQVAHAITFMQALQSGDEKKLVASCQDFLHEPYRRKLIPEFDFIHSYCFQKQFPMWISGSGPTMMAISIHFENIVQLNQWMKKTYPEISCHIVTIDQKGAIVDYE